MKPVDFSHVRNDIREMFLKQGHARIPMDYARQWLNERLPNKDRDIVILRKGLEESLTQIAKEVMDEGLNLAKEIFRENLAKELGVKIMKENNTKFYCFNCGARLFRKEHGFVECRNCNTIFLPALNVDTGNYTFQEFKEEKKEQ